MFTAEQIMHTWRRVINSHDYSEIDKVPLKELKESRRAVEDALRNSDSTKLFYGYIRARELIEKQEAKEDRRRKGEWKKWLTASVALPACLLTFQYLYFGEVSNRPFVSVMYRNPIIIRGDHVEQRADGTTFKDPSRKDLEVILDYQNAGKTPANITCVEKYLSYEGRKPFLLNRIYKEINVSPVRAMQDTQGFMILNSYVNNFDLKTIVYYYGKKFFGLYLGRPYKHYFLSKWDGHSFNILESKDIR